MSDPSRKETIRIRQFNEEVLFSDDDILRLGRQDIEVLKGRAELNRRRRIRLCAHKKLDDKVHEMLIVHTKETYVRPHKHSNKSESFHIIEGCVDVVIFDEVGNVVEVIQMGDYSSGRRFYYRISDPYYHTLLISSEYVVFHETTNGPFRKSDTIFPAWAPSENDEAGVRVFMNELERTVEKVVANGKIK